MRTLLIVLAILIVGCSKDRPEPKKETAKYVFTIMADGPIPFYKYEWNGNKVEEWGRRFHIIDTLELQTGDKLSAVIETQKGICYDDHPIYDYCKVNILLYKFDGDTLDTSGPYKYWTYERKQFIFFEFVQ